jgi:hypothetical protein
MWMLRFCKAIVPWAFAVLVFLALLAAVWTSLTFQHCVESARKNHPPNQQPEKGISTFISMAPTYRHCAGVYVTENRDAINAGSTFVIAIFTAILGIFTIRLAKATRISAEAAKEAADTARDEFAATHRPKIKIHVAEFKHNPSEVGEENRAGASVLCFNVGESAAKEVEVRGQIFNGEGFAVDVQRPLITKVPRLESGDKLRFDVTSDWLAREIAAGPRQGRNFYLVGWIAYRDGNGLRRETAYCLRADFGRVGGPDDRWVSAGKPEYEYAY